MIKNFNTQEERNAYVPGNTESTLMHVEETNECSVNGVNVVTMQPQVGDVLFLDASKRRVYIKNETLNRSLISADWTHVGYVFMRNGRKVGIINKAGTDEKYLDVCQYGITNITSTSLVINLRMSPDYAVNTTVNVTLASTDINAANAQAISEAVAAKAAEQGDTKAWWAYLADADGNKVDTDGTQIVIQCDECVDYRYYICSATGCTIAVINWGDMPASDRYFKGNAKNFRMTNNAGAMNVARRIAYINSASNTAPAPSADVPLAAETTVRRTEFESNQYCQLLRDTYATYEEYVRVDQMVVTPQKFGTFALPSDDELSRKYAGKTVPTKAGGTKAAYPALNKCSLVDYSVDGLAVGDWYLPGSAKGMELLKDATLALLAPVVTKMGTTAINNATSRWFAERYIVSVARFFYGTSGTLYYNYVNYRVRAQAVTLLTID